MAVRLLVLELRKCLARGREARAFEQAWLHVQASVSAEQDARANARLAFWCEIEQEIAKAELLVHRSAREARKPRRFAGGWKPSRART